MGIAVLRPDQGDPVRHGQRLLDMQVPFLPVLPHSPVIIDPVSDIGILLDLRDQDILPDGVDGPRLDEEHIPFLHRDFVEHFCQCIVPDPLCELLPADLPLEPVIEKGSRSGFHYIPHLCLSVLAFIFQRISIVRVDLDGQVLLRVDELDEHRKIPEPPAVLPEDPFSFCPDIFFQRLSRPGAFRDHGLPVRMAGEFPGLCQDLPVVFFVVSFYKPVSSPEVILVRRL